jgi:ABC-2 type transport system permease protein
MLFSLSKTGSQAGVIFIPALIICIGLSVMISLSYSFLWGSLAFYSPVAAEEVCTSVSNLFYSLRSFPLNGIGVVTRIGMLSVIPVGLYAWFPSVALMGLSSRINIVVFAAVSIAYLGLVLIVFRKGLQHYVKNGSYRYSDRGHRR